MIRVQGVVNQQRTFVKDGESSTVCYFHVLIPIPHVLTKQKRFRSGLVNCPITNWKIHCFFLMGKSTISTGPFSIAFCMFTRGYICSTGPKCLNDLISSHLFVAVIQTSYSYGFYQQSVCHPIYGMLTPFERI